MIVTIKYDVYSLDFLMLLLLLRGPSENLLCGMGSLPKNCYYFKAVFSFYYLSNRTRAKTT